MSPSVLVPMAPGFEEIELVTIVDTLRRAEVEVVIAGLGPNPVLGSRGIAMLADHEFGELDSSAFDAIVLPGGLGGTRAMAASEAVLEAVRTARSRGRLVAAICAAPIVLAEAGVLGDARITCHPSVTQELAAHDPCDEGPVVRSPGLMTSQGPGTALEFALALVEELQGPDRAAELRVAMVAGRR